MEQRRKFLKIIISPEGVRKMKSLYSRKKKSRTFGIMNVAANILTIPLEIDKRIFELDVSDSKVYEGGTSQSVLPERRYCVFIMFKRDTAERLCVKLL